MSVKAQIELLGSELQPGETTHELCPVCDGGSSNEKSLAITRADDGNLLYVCHRASCDTKGGTQSRGHVPVILTPTKKRNKRFEGSLQSLSESQLKRIFDLWGILNPPAWYWTPNLRGRVAMSIRSPKYMHRGWVMRDISGRATVKALTYLNDGEVSLSWYKSNPTKPTILVEDIPSAVRASKHMTAVALLGTKVGVDKAHEIAENSPNGIIVALDQDATSVAFDIVLRYAALWGKTDILMLKKDIKDMKETELCELFKDFS
jgi:hypothetical protein